MKTMLWKELRENLNWAALALFGLLVAEFHSLSAARQPYVEDYTDLTLCSSAFLLVTAFGCSVIGAGLALVQILPELRRDQWAALLHRPVTRGTIFFGKAITGLLLYFAATILPFLASVYYVATPGNFAAPFVPGMMIPGLSDLFLGPVFYFATMLVCLHRGNWFGSRGVIALSVVPIFVWHLTAGWPFLLPIISSLLYLVAAWAAMLGNGTLSGRTRIGRLAFGLVVLMGAEALVLLVLFGVQFLPAKTQSFDVTPTSDFEVAPDGQVYLATFGGEGETFKDMNGKPVTFKNGAQIIFCPLYPLAWHLANGQASSAYFYHSPRDTDNYVTEKTQYDAESKEVWYLLIGQKYFIGYDKLSRRAISICDSEGFKPAEAMPKPFPSLQSGAANFRNPYLYWSGTRVYGLNFLDRSMVHFDVSEGPIWGAMNVAGSYYLEKPNFVAVAMPDNIRIFDADGKPVTTIAYPHDPAKWTSLRLGTNAAANQLYLESSAPPDFLAPTSAPKLPVYLDQFDLQGNILHTYSRPLTEYSVSVAKWTFNPSTFVSPLLPALVGTVFPQVAAFFPAPLVASTENFSIPQPAFSAFGLDLALMFGFGLILGAMAFVWARRAGFSGKRAGLWALFVLGFGLPGLVAFRLASEWPARIRCPECGKRRALNADECPACHRPWPAPASTGIEIFDQGHAAAGS